MYRLRFCSFRFCSTCLICFKNQAYLHSVFVLVVEKFDNVTDIIYTAILMVKG